MKSQLTAFFIVVCALVQAQVKIQGKVIDSETLKPIPYADILEGLAGTELLIHTEWNTDYNNRNYQILTGDDVNAEEATQNIEDVLASAGI